MQLLVPFIRRNSQEPIEHRGQQYATDGRSNDSHERVWDERRSICC